MPWFAGLFVSMFAGLASFFAQWITKKLALAAAAISTFAALTVALYASLSLILNALITTFPTGGSLVATMIWLAVPDSLPAWIAGVIAADTAIALYRWNIENLRLASYIT